MATLLPYQMPTPLSPEEADIIASRNYIQSPLLRLPGEIRNQIYAYAFTEHCVQVNGFHEPSLVRLVVTESYARTGKGSHYPLSQFISSTMACRQIYTETSCVIYRLNEFRFTSDSIKEIGKVTPHVCLQAIETVELVAFEYETFENMKLFVDIALLKLSGLRKVVVNLSDCWDWWYPSMAAREVFEKMFLGVSRKGSVRLEIVIEDDRFKW